MTLMEVFLSCYKLKLGQYNSHLNKVNLGFRNRDVHTSISVILSFRWAYFGTGLVGRAISRTDLVFEKL